MPTFDVSQDRLLRAGEIVMQEILPVLEEYIQIPNLSPHFDKEWKKTGDTDRAVALIRAWCEKQPIKGLTVEVIETEGRTPVIFMEIPATDTSKTGDHTVLLYGHLDKQPPGEGWDEDLGPYKPVYMNGNLYGRGGADDGYAVFASLTAIRLLQEQGVPHGRVVVMIEASEESGSPDLPHYVELLKERIGTPDLVVCLDSGCGNYRQLWLTTSLRGVIGGELTVEVLNHGVHSGDAGGIVPSSMRIMRRLLDRIEDSETGDIRLHDLHVKIPAERIAEAKRSAEELGIDAISRFPWTLEFDRSTTAWDLSIEIHDAILDRTWRPCLEVTGADGLPRPKDASNTLRGSTSFVLSLRLPPTVDPKEAMESLQSALGYDADFEDIRGRADVRFVPGARAPGWNAPPLEPWLAESVRNASQAVFHNDAVFMGEGGTIPFMGMLHQRFPQAQFLITGVLGPDSNAHGPNEYLNMLMMTNVMLCVARVVGDHAEHVQS